MLNNSTYISPQHDINAMKSLLQVLAFTGSFFRIIPAIFFVVFYNVLHLTARIKNG